MGLNATEHDNANKFYLCALNPQHYFPGVTPNLNLNFRLEALVCEKNLYSCGAALALRILQNFPFLNAVFWELYCELCATLNWV